MEKVSLRKRKKVQCTCAYCIEDKPPLFTLITHKDDKRKVVRYFCSFDHLRNDINDAFDSMVNNGEYDQTEGRKK